MFDDITKVKALERELILRRVVYPRQVAKGSMTQKQADHEISVFEDIANDYKRKITADLFAADSPGP